MDSSTSVDALNDTAPMPELSFEDLLDDSPVKKVIADIDDPLGLEDELSTIKSDTLNTPGPKKPPQHMKLAANPTTTTSSAPVVLNSRNILPKSVASGSQLVKIAPKIIVSSASTLPKSPSTSTVTVTATTTADGKTAIKTPNGQILYIQKKTTTTAGSNGGTASMSNPALAAATTSAAGTNKTVAFKLMRTSGSGGLVPIKSTNAVAATTTTGATTTKADSTSRNTLTLSPKVGSQLTVPAGSKRVTSTAGGQVVVKMSPAAAAAAATSTSAATTNTTVANRSTATTTTAAGSTTTYRLSGGTLTSHTTIGTSSNTNTGNTNKGAMSGGHKIYVQSANGKQILVTNQQLIKLSPKPPTSGATVNSAAASNASTSASATTGGTTARQLQAIQLPGKSVQYLRVFPKGSADISGNAASGATATAALTSTSTAAGTTQSTNPTTSTIKILNATGVPPKFTVVRPSPTGSAKLILTQSPKKEGSVPVSFSPITSKVQKTIVTVPNLRPIGDGSRSQSVATANSTGSFTTASANAHLINKNINQSLIRSNSGAGSVNSVSNTTNAMMRKHKISEINSELKRITTASSPSAVVEAESGFDAGAPPEAKKLASGSRIVMLPRSMLRTTAGGGGQVRQVTLQSNAGTVGSNNGRQSPTRKLFQQQQQHQQQQQQSMHSVLKSNNTPGVNEASGQKSLLINGKTQALIAQQQQQQQQQQQKTLQLKRQLQQQQQQQQYDSKLPTLSKGLNANSSSNINQSGSNSTDAQNANNADNKLLNFKIKLEPMDEKPDVKPIPELLSDAANGGIRRKHCNCSKSQCLKLYCDCFANGEFCQDCTCKDCLNNLQNEDHRQRAIKNCLERNPSAFKPKITTSREQGDMRHNKGCNCKRSGCLKNYCECYEAKIPCSSNCKCVGCRNIEERPDLDMDPIDPKILATIASVSLPAAGQKRSYDKSNNGKVTGIGNDKLYKDTAKALAMGNDLMAGLAGGSSSLTGSSCSGSNGVAGGGGAGSGAASAQEKQQCNFITQEVVDATIQCMISQADECEKNGLPAYQTEKMVMEEMGRCLVEIIDFSIRNTDSSFTQD